MPTGFLRGLGLIATAAWVVGGLVLLGHAIANIADPHVRTVLLVLVAMYAVREGAR